MIYHPSEVQRVRYEASVALSYLPGTPVFYKGQTYLIHEVVQTSGRARAYHLTKPRKNGCTPIRPIDPIYWVRGSELTIGS